MLTPQDRTIVALDCSQERAIQLVDMLGENLNWVKVGMELFYATGSAFVKELKSRGLNVFLDLKLHDIPNTVEQASRVLAGFGADMITVHGLGSPKMIEAARRGLDEGARLAGLKPPVLLAVTILTSMDQNALESIGVFESVQDEACRLAKAAFGAGADGVVCSAFEAHMMRDLLGKEAYIVTPGIRPQGSATQDQSRVATPLFAIREGASHLVIGRPVTQAQDPLFALKKVQEELETL
ncbi:MAG: orotidine-5'-phosphate decarboxylase [Coriobacteriales bacterium]|nr:orotidine-5'-phosphate decarboxylase [Coriobacteriales bacterium]